MGINPAMASIPYKGKVLKASRIYIAALLCVIRREYEQTLGRVRVRTVVIISLQQTKG